jgi:hypothetical protein
VAANGLIGINSNIYAPPGQGAVITPTGLGFTLLPDGRYETSSAPGGPGDYSYDLTTTEVKWTSGPFVTFKPEYTFNYAGLNSSGDTITLNKDGKRQQSCVTQKKAPG